MRLGEYRQRLKYKMINRSTGVPNSGFAQPHPAFSCWAKLSVSDDESGYHPLLCHMVDVAMVALEIWRSVLSSKQRSAFAVGLGFGENQEVAGSWCAFVTGLHDLGKASPAFQLGKEQIRQEVRERLRGAGLSSGRSYRVSRAPHGTITAATLPQILKQEFGMQGMLAQHLGVVAGGHHGILPAGRDIKNVGVAAKGRADWDVHRRTLADELADALELSRSVLPCRLDNATAMMLAGFISVVDWIGSNTDFFPCCIPQDTQAYANYAHVQAKSALNALGWLAYPIPGAVKLFTDLFPAISVPNNLQRSVESVASALTEPSMVIVEAPMGEGKTEAAIYLADYWSANVGQVGHYFALPTQATSNQMFGRVRDFLRNRYGGEQVQLQLLHGHASLSAEFEALRHHGSTVPKPQYSGVDDDDAEHAVVASEWFTYRKRGLLSPFGVGTIDQVLLSVLRTRHVFVRLFGLAHKTIIVDEVHAYDTYMTTLLERLLEWLAALGCSVVLLSATLPQRRREQLLEAYAQGVGVEPQMPCQVAYPRVSWVSRSARPDARTVKVSARGRKEVLLEWIDGVFSDEDTTEWPLRQLLQSALARGGCAAVICNTVRRAQEVYRALKPHFRGVCEDGSPELDLLHSQYPFGDREIRERRSLARYGKPGDPTVRRPRRGILVATQIIEQSLDLDFDLMVSDMAPADLLLQRVGRLHRHERERPQGLENPRLLICNPNTVAEVPRFDPGTATVYDEHILLRSWLALWQRGMIRVPDDVESIIEAVYDDNRGPDGLPQAVTEAWNHTRGKLNAEMERYRAEAQTRWVRSPSYTGQLWRLAGDIAEEDAPEFHPAHQALTRLSSPSVPTVLLYGNGDTGDTVVLDNMLASPLDMNRTPSLETTKRLLMRSVTISNRRVVFQLLDQSPPPSWRRSRLLRNHRAIFLDSQGTYRVGDYLLMLDADIGVTVSRSE
jgi:CRISPR-associated endonuclease/helicase Cas3